MKSTLSKMYSALLDAFGYRNWWPAHTPFEVIVGAVLTQNTNWQNVEKAIANLTQAGMLRADLLADADLADLHEWIRPSGYFRQKAVRLKRIAGWVRENCPPDDPGLAALRRRPAEDLRGELLALSGIGPETADSILLYALDKPVFVVDSYTVRVLARHGLVDPDSTYHDVQAYFHERLSPDEADFKDFHAQFVEVGKRYCRKRAPLREGCPLYGVLGAPTQPEEWA